MDYFAFHFSTDPGSEEALLGLLSGFPFESFEEPESGLLVAYLPASVSPEGLEPEFERLRELIPFEHRIERIAAQNWNEVWESNFPPIQVGNFCGIRAEFHPPFGDTVQHELCIQPRMAFGTGHHETTYMMIEIMEGLPLDGKSVLDYGSGTGILAILAHRLGARSIDALEIETIACENAADNCRANQAESVHVIEGTLEKVLDRRYDIILANINRHVLLESFAPLYEMLPHGGHLVISGILGADRDIVSQALEQTGFQVEAVRDRGQWLAMQTRKP
jgi:ribosomal protein L11 methyltransferase